MSPTTRIAVDTLMPVDWVAIEPHYRAGIRSLRSLKAEFGVSPTGIVKHFDKLGIQRDLKARIHARAQELVDRAVVDTPVDKAGAASTERAIVDTNANILAAVQIAHRKDIAETRAMVVSMLGELRETCDRPDLFGSVHMVLTMQREDEPAIEALRDAARLVSSLPQRAQVVKTLTEALGRLIGMEREAFGLDTVSGTDGRPLVIIKDFTGRNDPDSPLRDDDEDKAS